jgi:Pentapeptide repeats (9 copies)
MAEPEPDEPDEEPELAADADPRTIVDEDWRSLGEPHWQTCAEDECVGSVVGSGTWCVRHLPPDEREHYLAGLGPDSTLDARGVAVDGGLLDELLGYFTQFSELPRLPAVRFDHATFTDDVELFAEFAGTAVFDSARFNGRVEVLGAQFKDRAHFSRVLFEGDATFNCRFDGGASFFKAFFMNDADFHSAHFGADTTFFHATIWGRARFNNVTAADDLDFGWVKFDGGAEFPQIDVGGNLSFKYAGFPAAGDGGFPVPLTGAAVGGALDCFSTVFGAGLDAGNARFKGWADFTRAPITGHAVFRDAEFAGGATFAGAAVQGTVADFSGATFGGNAFFVGTRFEEGVRLRKATCAGRVDFSNAEIDKHASFAETAFRQSVFFTSTTFAGIETLILDGASFAEPLDLRIATGELGCRGTRFLGGANVRLEPRPLPPRVGLARAEFGAPSLVAGPESENVPLPRLESVRNANVASLTVADVDLAECRFGGAFNLDKLRFDGKATFGAAPPGRWTRRRVIAEERDWRVLEQRREAWRPPGWEPPDGTRALPPREIADVYRALRKGREDAKDEPGAADFYYGEMEMRRHAGDAPWGERLILTLYWLLSGYALRASRALLALLVLVALFSVAFYFVGFEPRPSGAEAVIHSVGAALLRNNDTDTLTRTGEALQIGIRLLGPVCLGLALLSIRGRVKR